MGRRTVPGSLSAGLASELPQWLARLAEGDMTRRQFVARAAAAGLTLSAIGTMLAACGGGGGGGTASAPSAMGTELPATLHIYNWSEYTSPKVLKDFERKYGVKCDLKLYDSNEELSAKLKKRPDAYDVIVPEDAFVSVLASAGLLRPLDMSLISNFRNVADAAFRQPPFDPGTDGKKYSVPYMFGTIGVGVRLDQVPDPGTSWSIMYDRRYKGRMSMLDGSREVLGPALFSLGHSLNTTDQGELDEATVKAIEQKPLVKLYAGSGMAKRMVSGLPLVECWDGDVVTAMNQVGISKLKYLLPDEGYNVWMDGVCIPASSPNPYAAHLFLNFLLDPVNAAESANYIGYQPVVSAADPLIKSLVQRAMRPTAEVISGGTFVKDLGNFNAAYDEAWAKVQAA